MRVQRLTAWGCGYSQSVSPIPCKPKTQIDTHNSEVWRENFGIWGNCELFKSILQQSSQQATHLYIHKFLFHLKLINVLYIRYKNIFGWNQCFPRIFLGIAQCVHINRNKSDVKLKVIILIIKSLHFTCKYRGIHKNDSRYVVSAVCITIYTIYISLCTQTAETTSPEPFSRIPLYITANIFLKSTHFFLGMCCSIHRVPHRKIIQGQLVK